MKTRISDFCHALRDALLPLAACSRAAQDQLAQRADVRWESLDHQLAEIQHDLDGLLHKVEQQQVYVLIFGPIKSGKSTLMNAICGSYVSEVTALPAYPCMVHVKHGEATGFIVVRYNGDAERLPGPPELQDAMEHGHRTLADHVRECEDRGEVFDPAVHLPSAIRRVEVQLPVENLRESGTVLVDTPGLYTKMKFGYDLMTQEFRHSAACAVFVVKADNLFLEQVFTDFNELLELFSRIFVVVNIDATKRDLRPDGTLAQSLESRDPHAIVEAFESLTMSAPLRHAVDTGRLRIYPIDLLHAAARRLGGGDDSGLADLKVFDHFVDDLTAYLNSNDHVLEFMADTLRRGTSLCDDIRRQGDEAGLRAVRSERRAAETLQSELAIRRYALARVAGIDWGPCLAPFRLRHRRARRDLAAELQHRVQGDAEPALQAWLESDDSLQGLVEQRWGAVIRRAIGELREHVNRRLEELSALAAGGLSLPRGIDRDLTHLDLDFPLLAREALASIPPFEPPAASIHVDVSQIPVKRSFWDILFFRRAAGIRRRLFGPPEAPQQPIRSRLKRKRLGPEARAQLLQTAQSDAARALTAAVEAAEQQDKRYADALRARLQQRLDALQQRLTREHEASRSAEASIRALERHLDDLLARAGEVRRALGELQRTAQPPQRDAIWSEERIDLAAPSASPA